MGDIWVTSLNVTKAITDCMRLPAEDWSGAYMKSMHLYCVHLLLYCVYLIGDLHPVPPAYSSTYDYHGRVIISTEKPKTDLLCHL